MPHLYFDILQWVFSVKGDSFFKLWLRGLGAGTGSVLLTLAHQDAVHFSFCTHKVRGYCIHTHTCTRTHTHMHAHTNKHVRMHACTITNTHTHACTHIHKHVRMHDHRHTHACVSVRTLILPYQMIQSFLYCIVLIGTFISNLFKSTQSAAGMKALKHATNHGSPS